jgi:hypothetical protein
VAAQLRRELQIDVEMVRGQYGELKVLADGDTVIDGGALKRRKARSPTHRSRWGEGLAAEDMKKCVWIRPELSVLRLIMPTLEDRYSL